ncbi:MAG: ubiquinone/menaquinone biosynthesis C-methylase UbiE [Cellvibrionaceae bacterium]|jgi:ubiquinone/menaquinone biosynthesis C-methylase UbiE
MMASLFLYSLLFFVLSALFWWLWHWLIIITEGVYLGPKLVIWLYNREAWRYDGIKEYAMSDELILLVEPVLGETEGRVNPNVLDVATGTGRVPLFLFKDERFQNERNGRVIGLDASQKMLDLAEKNLEGFEAHVDLILGSADKITFPDNHFDAVTCLESLEFFPNPEKSLDEMIRVLQPDCSLLVTRRAGWEARWFLGRYYSRDDFATLLRKKGLTDVVIYSWQDNYDLAIGRKLKDGEII